MSYPVPDGRILLARDRGLSVGLIKFLFPWISGCVGHFLLYRVVLPKADHVFVQSDRMKTDLAKRGIRPERMTPVPMGVDVETLQSLDIPPMDDRLLAGKRVLVYLGTLDRPRRIETLFEMLAIVKHQFPNVLLLLVGDTHEERHQRWLEMKANEAGVSDHLFWTGWLPMDEGWRYVRAAEVVLSPIPRGDLLDCGSPTKVPEYLTLCVPVVCNDPDQEQVIRQSGAGLCVPYSAGDFASAVIKMLRLDKNERDEIGIKGMKNYVKHYRDYRIIGGSVAVSYGNLLLKSDHEQND